MTEELLAKVATVNASMMRVISLYTKWAQKHEINLPMMKTLYLLHYMKPDTPITQKQISEELATPKQTINNIIITLKQDGYILLDSSTKDKRTKNIVLTEKGKQYAELLLTPLLKIESTLVQRMGGQADKLIESATAFGDYFELEMIKEDRSK